MYVRAGTYPLKRKLGWHKSGVPSSITNIDLNHKDRPRYSVAGARLVVQFLLSSFLRQFLDLRLFLVFFPAPSPRSATPIDPLIRPRFTRPLARVLGRENRGTIATENHAEVGI